MKTIMKIQSKPEPSQRPDVHWRTLARCRTIDPDTFFPEQSSQEQAKALCSRCEVRADCLKYALEKRVVHGIWGGLNESERKRIRNRR